jgi:hypothetical protein
MGHSIHDADGTDAGPTVSKTYDLRFVTRGARLVGARWLAEVHLTWGQRQLMQLAASPSYGDLFSIETRLA